MREDKQMQQHKKNKAGMRVGKTVNKPDKHNLTEMIKVSITGDR